MLRIQLYLILSDKLIFSKQNISILYRLAVYWLINYLMSQDTVNQLFFIFNKSFDRKLIFEQLFTFL